MSQALPLIVGLGCRVPGARGHLAMWNVLSAGRCAVTQADSRLFDPAFYYDPHRTRRGKSYTFAAGQIDDLYDFDANFFGISPRAASEMDPQQRLMLQSVWEAVEDSGTDMADLAGDRTGVFVGASLVDMLQVYYLDPARGGSNFMLGNTLSTIANRISSVFDFGGPSYVLDTACSSGLYALHQASEAIRAGQIDTAIVGGVHVVRSPGGFVGFSQARMLSPSGLCRAFDASADGYVRSEACVTVVLMAPGKAKALGSRTRGRLLATGVNSDGEAKQLTVPSAARQESLLTRVLDLSGKDPEALDFYEAHGTGTQVGDRAEAIGLGNALGTLRRSPLLIGSAKTNFGHSEPASGLVGLAKVLLAMEHRSLPPSLHFDTPNPEIDFDALNLKVQNQTQPLPEDGPLVAGISSFGFGGTNAAALVESIGVAQKSHHPGTAVPDAPWLLLSAESRGSLDRLSEIWADKLDATPRAEWGDLAKAAARRASLSYRRATLLSDQAPALLRQKDPDQAMFGKVTLKGARTVFAFSGNGAQHKDMGRTAYAQNRDYREVFDAAAAAFAAVGVADLADHLGAEDLDRRLASPLVAQPLLFACQVAHARALNAMDVSPHAVIGHSLGEIAALHIAGAFTLEDAAKIVARRSARFETLRGQGGMVAVAASEDDIRKVLGGFDDRLAIAAINSPNSVTVSGPLAMLERLANATLNGKRLAMVRLGVEVAYHSAALDPLEGGFGRDLADIEFHPLELPVAGAVVGRMLRQNEVGADYLWRNARDPVRFHDALTALAKARPAVLLEIAPKPVLAANIRDSARLSGLALEHYALGAPGDKTDDVLASCWVNGISIEKSRICGGQPERHVPLPGYPWEEQEFFPPLSPDGFDGWGEFSSGALAGRRIDRDVPVWIAEFTPTNPAWVADHLVGGATILPATALFEIALSCGAALWPASALELSEFNILQPAVVGEDGIRIRTTIDRATGAVTLTVRPRLTETEWVTLAQGTLRCATGAIKASWPRKTAWPGGTTDGIYDKLSSAGLRYGPTFQLLEDIAPLGKAGFRCRLKEATQAQGFCLDPQRLDAVFHGLVSLADGRYSPLVAALGAGAVLVPNRVGRLRWNNAATPVRFARVAITAMRARSVAVDVTLFDAAGKVIAKLEGVEFALLHLGKSKALDPALWRRSLPKWRAPDAPLKWPRGWAKPAKTLQRLGLSQTCPELRSHAMFADLHRALASGADPSPALRGILEQTPDLADDARVQMALWNGQQNYAVAQNAASQRAIWKLADKVCRALCTSWRPSERLNLAVLGLADPVVVGRWAEIPEIDSVILSSPEREQQDYLAVALGDALLPRLRSQIKPGQADLILAVGDAAEATNLDAFAAPDALVIRLDTVGLGPQDLTAEGWFATFDDIAVRLRIGQAGAVQPVPQVQLTNLGPGALPTPELTKATKVAAETGTPTLVHLHGANETASASLARLLLRLKPMHKAPGARMLLLVWNQGGANFGALARAAGSVLRSLGNEHPDWDLSALAVEEPPPENLWPALLDATRHEPILYVRGADIRIERTEAAPEHPPRGRSAALAMPFTSGRPLKWRAVARPKPKAGEVEIEVAATGLNFRDVLWAQGRIPDRLFDLGASPPSMGMECAGLVSRVGSGTDMAVGQPVMTFAPEAFRRHLVMPEASVVPVPRGIAPEAATGIPVAFATAWESLHRIARLSKGESVLIHGAAGGVGMAAMQIAQGIGARIFATAGTPDKRAFVRAMGAEAVFDSRDLSFGDAVILATGGRGVDVVLNSLAGAAMERSVACLAPFGRFVELGKRDSLEGTRMDLRPFLRNLSYFAYDLDQRLAADPEGVRNTMVALSAAFGKGALRPLPATRFAAEAVDDAVRHMQAARHLGKIVVTPTRPRPARKAQRINGSWVIIGGTGGVGLSLAAALRRAGAEQMHLVSRSGKLPLGSGPERAWATGDSAVTFHAADASDPKALAALLGQIGPITGVIHAAMTLRDRLLKDLDAVETETVIGSKLGVAEALDAVLRGEGISPDNVLFLSSVAGYLGNPGQIAYAAANASLEAIAERRRKDGLAGAVLALGPIRDRGVLTRDSAKSQHIARTEGIDYLSIEQCIKATLDVLRHPPGEDRLFAPLDWRALARMLPGLAGHGFDRVVSDAARRQKTARDLTEALKVMRWPAALKLVQSELNEAMCSILKLPADQFETLRPLSRYGIDSLMAMELRLEVEQRFGFALPVASLTETATAAGLAVAIVEKIREGQA